MRLNEKKLIEKYITDDINITNGIDIGCGPKIKNKDNCDGQEFQNILLGIDKNKDFEPDLCCDALDINKYFKDSSIKLAIMVHVLEDLENPYEVLRRLVRLLAKDGILIIICPYRGRYPRIGTKNANGGHKFDYEPYDIEYMIWRTFVKQKRNYEIEIFENLECDSFGVVVKKKFDKLDYSYWPGWQMCDDDGSIPNKK